MERVQKENNPLGISTKIQPRKSGVGRKDHLVINSHDPKAGKRIASEKKRYLLEGVCKISNRDNQSFQSPKRYVPPSNPKLHHSPDPKKLKEFIKIYKTHRSNAKILLGSPYSRNQWKGVTIDSKKTKNSMLGFAHSKQENENFDSFERLQPQRDSTDQFDSQLQKQLNQKYADRVIVITLKRQLSDASDSSSQFAKNFTERKRCQPTRPDLIDISISLARCTTEGGFIDTDKILGYLVEHGHLRNVQTKNIIGFEIEKSYLGQSPALETLNYLLANRLLTLDKHLKQSESSSLLRIKPVTLRVSNLASAIIASNSKHSLNKENKPLNLPGYQYSQQVEHKRPKKFNFTLNDFKVIRCLGSGGFSTVYLVKGLFNNKYYAMKLIDKSFILETERQGIVSSERYILELLSEGQTSDGKQCSFFTKLEFAFETCNHFLFFIEYCPGGELFNRLRKVKKMSEEEAKFYFLEILTGLDHIHSQNIVYRDLKPENLLIDKEGHIKIADFGLSKSLEDKKERSFSFCGSPEYMAPEMLTKSGHNYLLDYYCLGALLYELVIGVPPYYSLNQEQLYESILTEELSFPSHVSLSPELRSLLSSLLNKETRHRLGSICGTKEIMAHPWIGKISRAKIMNRQLIPPYVPDPQQFNFDLSDVKSNLEDIEKLLDQDRKTKTYESCFSSDFVYSNREELETLFRRLETQDRAMRVDKIQRSPRAFLSKCQSLRKQRFSDHTLQKLINSSHDRLFPYQSKPKDLKAEDLKPKTRQRKDQSRHQSDRKAMEIMLGSHCKSKFMEKALDCPLNKYTAMQKMKKRGTQQIRY